MAANKCCRYTTLICCVFVGSCIYLRKLFILKLYALLCNSVIYAIAGVQGWSGETRNGEEVDLKYNGVIQNIGLSTDSGEPVFFVAPGKLVP